MAFWLIGTSHLAPGGDLMEYEQPISERQADVEAKLASHQPRAEMTADARERLFAEHDELNARLAKLESFVGTVPFDALPGIERADLRDQLEAMRKYMAVLARRAGRQRR